MCPVLSPPVITSLVRLFITTHSFYNEKKREGDTSFSKNKEHFSFKTHRTLMEGSCEKGKFL